MLAAAELAEFQLRLVPVTQGPAAIELVSCSLELCQRPVALTQLGQRATGKCERQGSLDRRSDTVGAFRCRQ